jgi:hypothetical protein
VINYHIKQLQILQGIEDQLKEVDKSKLEKRRTLREFIFSFSEKP